MATLEAVCFDLDNTLCVPQYDDEEIHDRIFERVGVEPFFDPPDVYAVDPADLPVAESSHEHYVNLYTRVAENVGGDPALAPDLADVTVDVLDPATVGFRDGAEAAFRWAREHYDVGLLTLGYEDEQRTKIEALGIGDDLDAVEICDPGTDDALKPDPEPFERVLGALDTVPGAAVYVGDSLGGDVGGARNVGMKSAWVPVDDPPADPDPEPTWILDSPGDLPTVL